MDRAAAVVSDPVYGSASIRSERAEKPTTRAAYVATADVRCPICDEGEHNVSQCRKFIEMNPNEKLDTALRKQICFMCLIPGHITRECTNPVKCQECGQRHATMLHEADWEGLRQTSREKRESKAGSPPENEGYHGHHVASNRHVMASKVALPFLLVKVTSPETGVSVKTYALLDSGSNVSLCQDQLLRMLKTRGRIEKMSLTTLEKENNETTARVVSLRVSSLDGSEELTIPQVHARSNLHLSSSNLVTEAEVQRWPHRKDLPLHHAEIDDVMLLIGQDSPEALMPITTVPGGKGEPYAVRTRLGWTVSGPVSSSSNKVFPASHYISNGDLLHEKVERFWKLESSGIYEQERGMSVEDRRVLELWDENVKFSDGHYTLPIPFKNPTLKLPDNQQMAEKRLSSLKRKLLKNHDLHRKYMDGMNDLLKEGYAVSVPKKDVTEWRYVPTHENPADDASRGVPASGLSEHRWLHGPEFLQSSPERWPSMLTFRAVSEDDPEVKKAVVFTIQDTVPGNPVNKLISGISNWTRLIRILACFTLIPEVHRTKVPFAGSLEAEHLQRAEEILIRHIQNQCYPEEIKAITRGRSIPSSSPLARLRPVLQDGVLVVPGRLTHTSLPSHAKRPATLPACHPAVERLVRHVHERTAHSGRGYVLAELRRRHWIVGATPLVKKIIRHCVACRRRDVQPCQQREADLPIDRVTPHKPAFTSVGVDYFGPFVVKRGRGREKRYGRMFTCLTTRAVHIEQQIPWIRTPSSIACIGSWHDAENLALYDLTTAAILKERISWYAPLKSV